MINIYLKLVIELYLNVLVSNTHKSKPSCWFKTNPVVNYFQNIFKLLKIYKIITFNLGIVYD